MMRQLSKHAPLLSTSKPRMDQTDGRTNSFAFVLAQHQQAAWAGSPGPPSSIISLVEQLPHHFLVRFPWHEWNRYVLLPCVTTLGGFNNLSCQRSLSLLFGLTAYAAFSIRRRVPGSRYLVLILLLLISSHSTNNKDPLLTASC